ncbi:hypothetical protein Tco_1456415 [Tanacetum coccineum]
MAKEQDKQQQQNLLNVELVPINEQVKIPTSNFRIALEKIQPDVIYKVCLDILKQYSFYNDFTATADAPEIYMQRFWYTITYDLTTKAFFFTMGDKHEQISKRHLSFHHVIKIDTTLGNLKFVNKGSKEPIIGMAIPIVMLNDDIKASAEYSKGASCQVASAFLLNSELLHAVSSLLPAFKTSSVRARVLNALSAEEKGKYWMKNSRYFLAGEQVTNFDDDVDDSLIDLASMLEPPHTKIAGNHIPNLSKLDVFKAGRTGVIIRGGRIGDNLFSVGQFVILILKLPSETHTCFVRDIKGTFILNGSSLAHFEDLGKFQAKADIDFALSMLPSRKGIESTIRKAINGNKFHVTFDEITSVHGSVRM